MLQRMLFDCVLPASEISVAVFALNVESSIACGDAAEGATEMGHGSTIHNKVYRFVRSRLPLQARSWRAAHDKRGLTANDDPLSEWTNLGGCCDGFFSFVVDSFLLRERNRRVE